MAKGSSSSVSAAPAAAPVTNGQPPKRSGASPSYIDIDRIRSAEGIVAIISLRKSTPRIYTFGIFREYERDGVYERTQFVPETYGAAYLDMVKIVIERIAKLRADNITEPQPSVL